MKQYIDKSTLVTEVERRIEEYKEILKNYDSSISEMVLKSSMSAYQSLLHFLDTLEVKEINLEKEIDKIWNPHFNLGWDEKSLLSINHEGFTTIAKHFYELGLKARKGE